jgi:DNA-binding XRE family transcriptional regulator
MKPKIIPLLTISGQIAILNCPKCKKSHYFYIKLNNGNTVVCESCTTIYPILETFEDKLKAFRDMNYFNNEQLADNLGVSYDTLMHWLRGRYSETATMIIRTTLIMKNEGIG